MSTQLLVFARRLAALWAGLVAAVVLPAAPARIFDVKAFGAAGDRQTLDTAAIQRAIDACHGGGGGVVYFPTGGFLSALLVLRSNVTLELSPGAVLLCSPRLADFPDKRHLLFADGVENVAITGGGAIDGQGDAWFDQNKKPLAERLNQLIEIDNARGFRMEGVTVRRSGNWTFRVRNCEDVKVRGVSMLNDIRHVNTDGLQIDTSRNVLISDCHIEGGDDCIVMKSDARLAGGANENITVSNCVLVSAACALKFGTGTYRDSRHCLFTNCVIRESRTGIALMMKDGGTIEDVRFSNIVMTTAPKWGQGLEWPIVVDIERRTNESKLGRIRDVVFSGITVYSKGRILVEGTPASPVEGITFRDVTFRVTGFEAIERGKKPRGGPKGASDDSQDYGATPGAFIMAHVRGLRFEGVNVFWPADPAAPDRHLLWTEDVGDAHFEGLYGAGSNPRVRPIEQKAARNPW